MGNNQSLFTNRTVGCSSVNKCIEFLININSINNLEKNKINGLVYDYANRNQLINNNSSHFFFRTCHNYNTNINYLEKISIDHNNSIIRIELINNSNNNTNYSHYFTEYEIIQKNSSQCLIKCRIQFKYKLLSLSGLIASYLCCCLNQYYSETDIECILDSIEKGLIEKKNLEIV